MATIFGDVCDVLNGTKEVSKVAYTLVEHGLYDEVMAFMCELHKLAAEYGEKIYRQTPFEHYSVEEWRAYLRNNSEVLALAWPTYDEGEGSLHVFREDFRKGNLKISLFDPGELSEVLALYKTCNDRGEVEVKSHNFDLYRDEGDPFFKLVNRDLCGCLVWKGVNRWIVIGEMQ